MARRGLQSTRFVLAATLLALAAPASSQAARMVAKLDRSRIYFGTQTLLTVEVGEARGAGRPTVTQVAGLSIQPYGRASVMRDLFSGRTTHRHRFLVTPEKAGTYTIPAVVLKVGGSVMRDGPFTLQVVEAPLRFRSVRMDPPRVLVGETARLEVRYQGVRPGVEPVVPQIAGLHMRPTALGRVEVTEREGLPVTVHQFEVVAQALGSYQISDITFDGVPAAPAVLTVSPFVIAGTQIGERTLVVGSRTTAHVLIRGLSESEKVTLVAPTGVSIAPSKQKYSIRQPGALFSFDVTAREPGSFTIDTVQLADGRTVQLEDPITLAVRRGGAGDIFACRGTPSSAETVVGEPFTIDYEVFFRGDLQGAAVDLSQALFANKEYIKVEAVDDLSYPDWRGEPLHARLGDGRIRMLLGSGAYNGQKEQLLRFALRVTPLATGTLPLDGLHVILLLQIREERRTGNMFFSSSQTRQFSRQAEVPPHHVVDPPGITRPPGYRDAVGRSFDFLAELDRTSATAMSPLTLTMKITGDSVGPQFKPPLLSAVTELTRHFDVSSNVHGGQVEGNTITFTQVVRPRSEQVSEFPALPLVYYDYENKEYQTVYSMPIPLEVRPGSLVGAASMDAITVAGQGQVPRDQAAGVDGESPLAGLGANHDSLGDIVVAPLGFGQVLGLLVAGPAGVLLIVVGFGVARRRAPVAVTVQQKRSLVQSLGRLDQEEGFHSRLAEILHAYLRLCLDLPPGELSSGDLVRAFEARAMNGQLRDEILDIIEVCDAGRFATAAVGEPERTRLIERVREVLQRLERAVK